MLTEIEKKIVEKAANRIIDKCLEDRPENPSVCIKDRSSGVMDIVDSLQFLPKDHPIKPQLSKIFEIADNIKEDTVKWAVLRGVI